jgi:hypothetical protein
MPILFFETVSLTFLGDQGGDTWADLEPESSYLCFPSSWIYSYEPLSPFSSFIEV